MKYILIWAVSCVVLYAITAGIKYPNAFDNVAGVAIISLVILLFKLNKTWKGKITEIKTEEKHYAEEDGPGETVEIDYAYIKLANGKMKKVPNKGWNVGDTIEKKRGELKPQRYTK